MNHLLIVGVVPLVLGVICFMATESQALCQPMSRGSGRSSSDSSDDLVMITGYSKVRTQNQNVANRRPVLVPVVGSEKARELLLYPDLATAPPEPDSIFIRPMKNVKKVNFPDEIKK